MFAGQEEGGRERGKDHYSTCRCHRAPGITSTALHTLPASDPRATSEDAGPLAL